MRSPLEQRKIERGSPEDEFLLLANEGELVQLLLADGAVLDVDDVLLLLRVVDARLEFVDGVERDLDLRDVVDDARVVIREVGVEAAQHGLVRNDDDRIRGTLDLDDDGLDAVDEVHVGLAARVAEAQLVLLAFVVNDGVLLLDFLVGESVACRN